MKKTVLLLALIPLLVYSQEIFQKTITYPSQLTIREIIKVPDNGYLGCGFVNASVADSNNACIIRMDSLMNVLWCKTINMYAFNYFRCISPTSDGNYLLGGISHSEFSPYYGASLYKIDLSGNVLWHKIYSASYDDAVIGAYEQDDQSILMIIRHGVFGQPTKVIKTDNSGNDVLTKFNLSNSNSPPGILGDCAMSDGSGNYYIGGSAINSVTSKHVFYVCKINDSGPLWYCEYDFGRSTASISRIIPLNDGNIAVIGYIADETIPNKYSMVIMKVNAETANDIWTKEIKGSNDYNPFGAGILVLQNDELIIHGGKYHAEGTYAFVARFTASGEMIWAREYGEEGHASFGQAFVTASNRFSFVGGIYNEGPYMVQTDLAGNSPCLTYTTDLQLFDITPSLYPQDVITGDFNVEPASPPYTEKSLFVTENTLCSGIVSVTEQNSSILFSVYPNPSRNLVTVEMKNNPNAAYWINIYDTMGKLILRNIMNGHQIKLISPTDPGIYLLSITNQDNQSLHRQKLVVY